MREKSTEDIFFLTKFVKFTSYCRPYEKVRWLMLPRKNCVTLNRFRSNMRKCKSNLKKWGIINYAKRYYSLINCGGFIGG